MKIIIHRGGSEIGASCLEIQSGGGARIMVEAGSELEGEKARLPQSADFADAVFISHAHPDHFGLACGVRKNIPIYCGEITAKIIKTASAFNPKFGGGQIPFSVFKSGEKIRVKDILITPFATDHSVPGSCAFAIESGGKKILYTGDFRSSGRKKNALKFLVKNAKNPDALIVEGTRIEGNGSAIETEFEVEEKIAEALSAYENLPAFAVCSGINVDRIVSIFKACKRARRVFVCDIYTALVLLQMGSLGARVPQMTWRGVRVLSKGEIFASQRRALEASFETLGASDFRKNVYSRGISISLEEIAACPNKYLIKANPIEAIMQKCGMPQANIIYSMWEGYMDEKFDKKRRYAALSSRNPFWKIHASGHIAQNGLFDFIGAVSPKKLIPFHTNAPEKFREKYPDAIVGEKIINV
ncbi:MAG: MBL fold metallo-hydrolase [Opitutales bacterium]|nr:MBL fold metallo-hydrolase [Opitutales bacterium]